jgi:thiol-disulfide isomerase/thioredoxin
MKTWFGFGLFVAIVSATQSAVVEIGAPAPPVNVKQWIKGGPVKVEPGKVHVVEFWATWCEPCREAIPHMTELQKKFKDRGVVFMGLTDEAPSVVKGFVKKMGDKMEYAVGIDEQDKIFETYMNPFGETGIPHAFIIDKNGLLLWHGHPLGSLEKALEEILSGKFNLNAAKAWDNLRKLQVEYVSLVNNPGQRPIANQKAEQLFTAAAREPTVLTDFAWKIMTGRQVEHRDMPLALRAAKQAYDVTQGTNGMVLDAYARALCENGRCKEAAEIQKAAIPKARDFEQKMEFEASLKKYLRLSRERAQ